MSEILVTPIFLQMGPATFRVSEAGLTRNEMLPSGKINFLILLRYNRDAFDNSVQMEFNT
jgi:hypothetical protein